MAPRKLTLKQQAFVEAFVGNATDAARKAGYGGSDNVLAQQGRVNLRHPQMAAAIAARAAPARKRRIATREERQQFWTAVLADRRKKMSDRLRASELLAKSQADFIERHQHDVGENLASILARVRAKASPT